MAAPPATCNHYVASTSIELQGLPPYPYSYPSPRLTLSTPRSSSAPSCCLVHQTHPLLFPLSLSPPSLVLPLPPQSRSDYTSKLAALKREVAEMGRAVALTASDPQTDLRVTPHELFDMFGQLAQQDAKVGVEGGGGRRGREPCAGFRCGCCGMGSWRSRTQMCGAGLHVRL